MEAKIQTVSSERNDMRNKARRLLPANETEAAREKAMELTSEIKDLRRELKVCRQIEERSEHVRDNLDVIDKDRQREKER
jgi:hypothetical protein